MANTVPPETFEAVAKELLATSADHLAAERRGDAQIEEVHMGFSDARKNFLGLADALDALAADLRS